MKNEKLKMKKVCKPVYLIGKLPNVLACKGFNESAAGKCTFMVIEEV